MKKLSLLTICLCGLLVNITIAQDWVGISTGSPSGTYYRIGQDMVSVSEDIMRIKAHTSNGSVQNIERILRDKEYQYAIVQHDALTWYERNVDSRLRQKVNFIFPLYDEEVHIVVRKNINIQRLTDLGNKRVNVGRKKSGSWVTARLIKDLIGMKWTEYNDSPKDALRKLIKGEIDAMIYVVGKPAKIFEEYYLPPDASNLIELLSCKHSALDDVYVSTSIEAGTYPWQTKTVAAYSTKAILVTFNYSCESDIERFRYAAQNICYLINAINRNLDGLKQSGHRKWKEISPRLSGINWPVHPKAQEALKDFNCKSCLPNTVDDTPNCLACDLKVNNARNFYDQGRYCDALRVYNKIMNANCASCPALDSNVLQGYLKSCQAKCDN